METFIKYKPYLEEFNYPNVNVLTDEQITDIFKVENRQFLLSWLVKILNSQFEISMEWSKTTLAMYADFFHESGFCSTNEKLAFIEGLDLSVKKQMIIFDRIFAYLKDSSLTENLLYKNIDENLELESFLIKDINLFSTLGPLKIRSLKQREQKLNYYKEEMEKLKQAFKNNEFLSSKTCFDNSTVFKKEVINQNIENIKDQAKKLKEACAIIEQLDNKEKVVEKIGFKSDIGSLLKYCSKELHNVLEYFKNVNMSINLNAEPEEDAGYMEYNEMAKIMKQHLQASYEIIKLMESINNE